MPSPCKVGLNNTIQSQLKFQKLYLIHWSWDRIFSELYPLKEPGHSNVTEWNGKEIDKLKSTVYVLPNHNVHWSYQRFSLTYKQVQNKRITECSYSSKQRMISPEHCILVLTFLPGHNFAIFRKKCYFHLCLIEITKLELILFYPFPFWSNFGHTKLLNDME